MPPYRAVCAPRIILSSTRGQSRRENLPQISSRIQNPLTAPSQILLPSGCDSGPEDRAAHLHVDLVEGAHDSLDPVLVHLREELLDGLLGLRGCWVGTDGRAGARSVGGSRLGRV